MGVDVQKDPIEGNRRIRQAKPAESELVLKNDNEPAPSAEAAPEFSNSASRRAIWRYAVEKAETTHQERLDRYNADKATFETALEKWLPADAEKLRAILEATRFVDWAHMAPDLLKTYRSRGRLSALDRGLPYIYNRSKSPHDPEFANMRRVNQFLRETPMRPSLERLLAVQRVAMSGEVDELPKTKLGKPRDYSVVGDLSEVGLSPLMKKRVDANPYLRFEPAGDISRIPRGSPIPGHILYPEPATVKGEALDRIQSKAPEVYKRVKALQGGKSLSPKALATLTRDLVTELAAERYDHFGAQCDALGELDQPQKVLDYIKIVALHYRDIISIHPLADGNGRSVRYESLFAPLDRAGISRPRLLDVDLDILHSPSGWVQEVQKGILSTHFMYLDVADRVTRGLRVESSPELVFPNLVREVGIDLRTRGRKNAVKNATLQSIDGGQFGAYVDTRMLQERALVKRFDAEPVATLTALRTDYKEFAKRTLVLGSIPGKGIEAIGLRLVDFDQRATFGVMQCADQEAWRYKIDRWYMNSLVWRGMCLTEDEMTTESCLSIFRELSWISLSNNAAEQAGKAERIVRKATQADFDRYNCDLVSGTLHQQVLDHVNEGTGYDESYGLSTSKNWSIAAGFAWGRGVFGYNNSEVEERQGEIRSRVVIGAYQGDKDVDVRRFRLLDERFRSRSGRQQEIMAVGGIDPDAIMVVQLLDDQRRVSRSFVRDPQKPSSICEIDGGFHPTKDPLKNLPESVVRARHDISG